MEILITETTTSENITGFNVTFVNRTKKKTINDADFFPAGSDVEVKIGQLKKLLKTYFDAQV
jgi:hypothetical protein